MWVPHCMVQALAQCDGYLRRMGVVKEAVDDTAGAAQMVARQVGGDALSHFIVQKYMTSEDLLVFIRVAYLNGRHLGMLRVWLEVVGSHHKDIAAVERACHMV